MESHNRWFEIPFLTKKIPIHIRLFTDKMFEFIFGFTLGVWAGQALPLPSIGRYVESFWTPKTSPEKEIARVDEESVPIFTGPILTTVPTS